MKPFTQETLSAAEYDYKVAYGDCEDYGRLFNVTYHAGERSKHDTTGQWQDAKLIKEHKPNQKKMDECLEALFEAMVELKLAEEVQDELQAA